ncbi:MAG: hypothetical protein MZV63_21140 [Marinilabiliales bacterium]|nr:hypothetical protein [Marinilabiliales bacterium]
MLTREALKVTLTVTNFGSARNTELLTDTVKQWNSHQHGDQPAPVAQRRRGELRL